MPGWNARNATKWVVHMTPPAVKPLRKIQPPRASPRISRACAKRKRVMKLPRRHIAPASSTSFRSWECRILGPSRITQGLRGLDQSGAREYARAMKLGLGESLNEPFSTDGL